MRNEPEFSPSVRAQILATEHWSLLATRSQTWNEVMGRITAQFTFTSAVLVALALVAQATEFGPGLRGLAIMLTAFVLVTGTMTTIRVMNASIDDLRYVMAMNRLRGRYLELDPGLAPAFMTGWTEDSDGIRQTYTMGAARDTSQFLGSAVLFMNVVNAIIAGFLAAMVVSSAGLAIIWVTIAGLVAGSAYIVGFMLTGNRAWRRLYTAPGTVPDRGDLTS